MVLVLRGSDHTQRRVFRAPPGTVCAFILCAQNCVKARHSIVATKRIARVTALLIVLMDGASARNSFLSSSNAGDCLAQFFSHWRANEKGQEDHGVNP
jgi:hypothetical protein